MKKLFGSFIGLIILLSITSVVYAATVYWPTQSTRVTSEYGMRYIDGAYKMHYGLDIGAKTAGVSGDSVKAIHNGVVKSAGYHKDYGYVVYINHTGANQMNNVNVQSVYAHLYSLSVSDGQAVSGNAVIGTMGETGDAAKGVHLHLETRNCPTTACNTTMEGNATNPRTWLANFPTTLVMNEFSLNEIHESHESNDLTLDSPNYYPIVELATMTPDELIAIGYPNPYEFQ